MPAQNPRLWTYSLPAALLLLAPFNILASLGMDIYLPIVPAMPGILTTTPEGVQLTLTLYMIMLGVGQILFGPLSNCFDRRKGATIVLALTELADLESPSQYKQLAAAEKVARKLFPLGKRRDSPLECPLLAGGQYTASCSDLPVSTSVLHWSDVNEGGFRIADYLSHCAAETGHVLRPWKMHPANVPDSLRRAAPTRTVDRMAKYASEAGWNDIAQELAEAKLVAEQEG